MDISFNVVHFPVCLDAPTSKESLFLASLLDTVPDVTVDSYRS